MLLHPATTSRDDERRGRNGGRCGEWYHHRDGAGNMKHVALFFFICLLLPGCSEDEKHVASIGIDMALVPAGAFQMGVNTSPGGQEEKPVHTVTLTRPFLLGCSEVTQAQWKAVMGTEPSWFRGDSLPVEQVSWFDAVAFCNRLSRLEGFQACYAGSDSTITCDFSKNGYRLPTEAEWEYACRSGTTTDFSTGNMTNPVGCLLDSALDRVGWYCGNADGETQKLRRKQPNAFGLYDMHGNVWEWCWDWYGAYEATPAADPRGPATGTTRVLRGGDFHYYAWGCRSNLRDHGSADTGIFYLGFRVARTY
jgi:formylglycine-generating enzyme required for sulfatase activity